MKQLSKMYSIDLTTTSACNFSCDYCFEHIDKHSEMFLDENYDLMFKRLDEVLESDFFKKNYQILGLNFWGGEPALNSKFIVNVFEKYKLDDRVRFLLYTNGSNFDIIFDIASKVKEIVVGGHPKFVIQMSYDGQPVHDIYRKKRDGSLTSSVTRQNILRLEKADIPYSIKATVTPQTFKYLPNCYDDIIEFYKMGRMDKWKNNSFFPTVDYHHIDDYKSDDFERSLIELKQALIEIAKKDLIFHSEFKRFFFAWFNPGKAICSAGKDLVVLNVDGNVYKCHGCLYDEKKKDHFITSLNDDSFVNKLENSSNFHSRLMNVLPPKCQSCQSPYCLKCNSTKYYKSTKEQYGDRWIDYDNEERMCRIFKVNEYVVLALKRLLK